MGVLKDWRGKAAPIETTKVGCCFTMEYPVPAMGMFTASADAILDLDNPSVVKYRCENFLLTPEAWYEERGFVRKCLLSMCHNLASKRW